ncbi:MAG TPA: hypothetical protein DCS12_08560 [Clostridiales bacterium]|nr:hypothetical protein [Clostridiales bacterium]
MDILVYTAVVVTITQVFKTAFAIESKFIPFVALGIGALFFAVACFFGATTLEYQSIMDALVGILSAMGLYSSIKSTGSILK